MEDGCRLLQKLGRCDYCTRMRFGRKFGNCDVGPAWMSVMSDEHDRKFWFDVGRFLFEKRKELANALKPIRDWFRTEMATSSSGAVDSLPKILIIGPGGVGKSTLASFLVGGVSEVIEDTTYSESLRTEEYRLDVPPASIMVPPGQAHRREWAWADIERGLIEGKFRGVLLIGAYGFHSIGPVSYTSLGYPSVTPEEFLTEYLKRSQKVEVEIVERLAPFLSRTPNPLWILTVVMKQDLWFDRAADVDRFYREGAFGKAVSKTLSQATAGRIRYEVAALSLIHQNFVTGRSELLKQTVAGYDWDQQAKALKEFSRVLNDLRTWESQT